MLYLLADGVCADDSQHTLARAVRYFHRFHVYTTMAMKTEHTDATLTELARYGDGLLTCLKDSRLLEERPSEYLFVKAHILFFLLPRCIKNNGSLTNTDCALMESHHITTKGDGFLTSAHNRTLQIMAVQQRR